MKILVISERLPSRIGGGAARQFNLIKHLADRHEFSVAAFAYAEDLPYRVELEKPARRVELVQLATPVMRPHSRLFWRLNAWRRALLDPHPLRGQFPMAQMREVVKRILAQQAFDIIQVHQAYLAPLVPASKTPTLLDMHDILSEHERRVMENLSKPTHRLQGWLEWRKMRALERRTVRRFAACTTVSEHDRDLLRTLAPGVDATVVPNGVDTDYFRFDETDPQAAELIFVGSLNYGPNSDAVRWFCGEILPRIADAVPGTHLTVVGHGAPQGIVALASDPRITVTGFVPDVRPFIAKAAVAIVPIRLGSGTRLKILDAWAMGRAVVSTTLGAEGLAGQDGTHIAIADQPNEFARRVVELVQRPEERARMGRAGRLLVEQRYAWPLVATAMDSVYERIAKPARGA